MVQVAEDTVAKLNFEVTVHNVEGVGDDVLIPVSGEHIFESVKDDLDDLQELKDGLKTVVERNLDGQHDFALVILNEGAEEESGMRFCLHLDDIWEQYRTGYAI